MKNVLAREAIATIKRAVNARDDADALDWLNLVRQRLFNQRGFDPTVTWCETIEDFCSSCTDCSTRFKGFRLPFGFRTIPAAWLNKHAFRINPRHMAWEPHIESCCGGGCISIQDRGWGAATKRDMSPCGVPDVLIFDSTGDDAGKVVEITVIDEEGHVFPTRIKLNGSSAVVEAQASGVKEIRFQSDIKCPVTLRQQTDSRILSVYRPGENAPNYRTFEVSDANCDDQIILEARRDYVQFVDENEILETGDLELVFNTAKLLEVKGRPELTRENVAAAQFYREELREGVDANSRNETGDAWNFRFSPARITPGCSKINTL